MNRMDQLNFNDIFKSSFLEKATEFSMMDLGIAMLLSLSIGIFIFFVYKKTFAGVMYSASFGVSIIAMTLITTLIILAVTSNIILSLGMVGALSIVSFRTAIKDFRDTSYIFWAIIGGICCGVGDYLVAGIGSAVVFLLLLVMGRVRNENRILLIIRGARSKEDDIEGTIFKYFEKKALQKVKNSTEQTVEFIFEMTRKTYEISYKSSESITNKLYSLGDIEYVNIITQNDEISG